MPFTFSIESWEPEPGADISAGPALPAGTVAIGAGVFRGADEIVEMRFLFEVGETERIGSIINSIKAIDGVFDATRMMPGANDRPKSKKKGKRS